MKIERIGDNKIKVLVNRDDVRVWNVDLKNFTDNTPEAQDLFWFALRQAEQDVNFSVGQAQLLVETMPAGGDGFVMIISKLECGSDIAEALLRTGKRVRKSEFKLCKRRKVQPLLRMFRFDGFDELVDGMVQISAEFLGDSRLFKYNGGFYLELLPRDSFGLFKLENKLSEFSERVRRPSAFCGVLTEHGELMIPSEAVETIVRCFA